MAIHVTYAIDFSPYLCWNYDETVKQIIYVCILRNNLMYLHDTLHKMDNYVTTTHESFNTSHMTLHQLIYSKPDMRHNTRWPAILTHRTANIIPCFASNLSPRLGYNGSNKVSYTKNDNMLSVKHHNSISFLSFFLSFFALNIFRHSPYIRTREKTFKNWCTFREVSFGKGVTSIRRIFALFRRGQNNIERVVCIESVSILLK